MTVFVVTCGAYASEERIEGVYSTRELADKGVDKGNARLRAQNILEPQKTQYCSIDEYILDEES